MLPDWNICLTRFEEDTALFDELGHGLEVNFEPAAFFELLFLQAGRRTSQVRRQCSFLFVANGLPVEIKAPDKVLSLSSVIVLEAQLEQRGLYPCKPPS